jgi:polyferredoxin
MARRKRRSKPTSKRRRPASQIALWVISLIIVLSMVIGFVISMLPTPTEPQTFATPTPIFLATAASTPTAEPSGTPTSTTEAPVPEGPATPQSDQ